MRGQGVDADAVRRRYGAKWGAERPHSWSGERLKVKPDTARLRGLPSLFLGRGAREVKSPTSRCGKLQTEAGQTVAGKCFNCQRKVRAPQSRVLGNAQAPRGDE